MYRLALLLAIVVAIVACGDSLPRTSLIANPADASAPLRDACQLTEMKCTRCHTIGRVLAWEAHTREQWEPLVTRMRRMVASGITRTDESSILDCLEQRK